MADLADRISRAAVAALDLAPFDERLSKLSRLVLTGGASRFAVVVTPDEPLHYVVPVGLPHERIDYGALLVQNTRVGLVWRDSASHDRNRVIRLDPTNTPRYSPLELVGEEWTRFDLEPDDPEAAFLVPPVNTPQLRSTLITLLHARPLVEAEEATAIHPIAPPPPPIAPPPPAPGAEPDPDPDATRPMQAIADDPEATRIHQPRHALPPTPDADATMLLYRDETASPAPPPAPAPTAVAPVAPAASPPPTPTPPPPPTPASLRAQEPVRAEGSQTLRGFLVGFSATLIVGLLAIIAALLL